MSLINTAAGWRQLIPLPPGAIAARDRRDHYAAEMMALCPDADPSGIRAVATQMLADLLNKGVQV